MRLKVQHINWIYPRIIMKTSVRGDYYSIRFHNSYGRLTNGWGHLNRTQAKRMVKDLEEFLSGGIK